MNTTLNLRYLVVGTGRSGTVSVAKLLTSLGIACSHEQIFNGRDPATSTWMPDEGGQNSACSSHCGLQLAGPPIAEASYMAVPFLEHEQLRNCAIIHVVRDPLKVIRSFLNNLFFFRNDSRPQEQFIREHLPHLDLLADPESRACYYYLRWNQMIEEAIAGRRYFLHPIENDPAALLDFLGVDPNQAVVSETDCNAYAKWPEHMRLRSDHPAITDEEIQTCCFWKEVATLARRYGYSYPTRFSPDLNRTTKTSCKAQPESRESPSCYPVQPQLIQENYYGYNIIQREKEFFGVHQEMGPLDFLQATPDERNRLKENGRLLAENSLTKLKMTILETKVEKTTRILATFFAKKPSQEFRFLPHLIKNNHRNFAIYYFLDRYFALSLELPEVNLDRLSFEEFDSLKKRDMLFEDSSPYKLMAEVEALSEEIAPTTLYPEDEISFNPELIEEGYRGFNLVAYRGQVFALAQSLGPLDLPGIDVHELGKLQSKELLFIGNSAEAAKRGIDQIHDRFRPRRGLAKILGLVSNRLR